MLITGGYDPTKAAAVISIANWVLIFSGTACGQIADRSGKRDQLLYGCMIVAIVTLLLLPQSSLAVALSLLFGLIGVAPAGVIMEITGEAMASNRRAFGIGVFHSFYYVLATAAPPFAGWLYDRSASPYVAIMFAALLFAATALANWTFRVAKRSIAAS